MMNEHKSCVHKVQERNTVGDIIMLSYVELKYEVSICNHLYQYVLDHDKNKHTILQWPLSFLLFLLGVSYLSFFSKALCQQISFLKVKP